VTFKKKNILLIATLDTKGEEAGYIKKIIEEMGHNAIVADDGIRGEPKLKADISRHEIATSADSSMSTIMAQNDESKASEIMASGLIKIVKKLCKDKKIDGVIAIGGSWGTTTASIVLRALPVGFPKVMVSTMASRDVRPYVGVKDINMVYSVTDMLGLNSISRRILANAAAAVVGMANVEIPKVAEKPKVGISLIGEQSEAAMMIKNILESRGYEVITFHATGSGGRGLEELIRSGEINGGVIDLDVHELYSNLFDPGGMFDPGPDRLEAAGEVGLPHIVVPGCAEIVSFPAGHIPPRFKTHKAHMHVPSVVAVKTERDEVLKLAEVISKKINKGRGPRAVVVPTQGFAKSDREDCMAGFFDPKVRKEFMTELKKRLDSSVRYVEVDAHINDPKFADALTEVFFELKGTK